jgi:hypothetical protein
MTAITTLPVMVSTESFIADANAIPASISAAPTTDADSPQHHHGLSSSLSQNIITAQSKQSEKNIMYTHAFDWREPTSIINYIQFAFTTFLDNFFFQSSQLCAYVYPYITARSVIAFFIIANLLLILFHHAYRDNFFGRFIAWAGFTWVLHRRNVKAKYNAFMASMMGTFKAALIAGTEAEKTARQAVFMENNSAQSSNTASPLNVSAITSNETAAVTTSASSSSIPRSPIPALRCKSTSNANSPSLDKEIPTKAEYVTKEGYVFTKHRFPFLFRRRHATLHECTLTFLSGDERKENSGSFAFFGGKVVASKLANTIKIVSKESVSFHIQLPTQEEYKEWMEAIDNNLKALMNKEWAVKVLEMKAVADEKRKGYIHYQ